MKTTYPSDLSDAEWNCLQRFLPPRSPHGRLRRHSLRSVFNALFMYCAQAVLGATCRATSRPGRPSIIIGVNFAARVFGLWSIGRCTKPNDAGSARIHI